MIDFFYLQLVEIGDGEKIAQNNVTAPKTTLWCVKEKKAHAFVHPTLKDHHVKSLLIAALYTLLVTNTLIAST
jgi:hypothetical protein